MKYPYSVIITAVAGLTFLAATSTPGPLAAKSEPEIDIQAVNYGTTVVFESHAASRDLLSFSVRVVGPDNYLFEQRTELAGSIDWEPETLAKGWYYWEAWVVTSDPGAPMKELQDTASPDAAVEHLYEPQHQQTHVKSGAFEVSDGILDDSGTESETEDGSPVRRVAAAILGFFIPSAQASGWEWDHFSILDGADDNDVFLQLHVDDNGNPNNWYFRNWHGNLLFQHGSNSSKQTAMQINGVGNVGVFTGSPTARLHVASPAGQIPFIVHGANTGKTEFAVTPYGHVAIGMGTTPLARLHVDDNNTGDDPFRITSGGGFTTPRFIVKKDGRTGIGTGSPAYPLDVQGGAVVNEFLHVRNPREGGSTRINLNADTSNVGNSDTWRLMNNVRDGRRFEIREGNRTWLTILKGGNAGFGTTAPAAPMHVQRADNTAQIRIEDVGATPDFQNMLTMKNNGNPQVRMENASIGLVWNFRLNQDDCGGASDCFIINRGSGPRFRFLSNGDMQINGNYIQGSSRTIKERITKMNTESVLNKLDSLTVHEWSYSKDPGSRHVGPMSEDFYTAFKLGNSDQHISPGDLAGVALAAAKALAERNKELESRNNALEARQALLGDRLARLEALLTNQP